MGEHLRVGESGRLSFKDLGGRSYTALDKCAPQRTLHVKCEGAHRDLHVAISSIRRRDCPCEKRIGRSSLSR